MCFIAQEKKQRENIVVGKKQIKSDSITLIKCVKHGYES